MKVGSILKRLIGERPVEVTIESLLTQDDVNKVCAELTDGCQNGRDTVLITRTDGQLKLLLAGRCKEDDIAAARIAFEAILILLGGPPDEEEG